MAAAKPASTDFGAAMAGLVLGGSVIFLVILTIVWLTNSHFADLKASGAHGAPPAAAAGAPAAATPAAAAPTGH